LACLLGVDVSTTGAKALAIDEDGRAVARALEEYPMYMPRPGWAEQDPADWWAATKKAVSTVVKSLTGGEIAGVGLTGQMHGSVFVDKGGEVLRPCIMWNDQRTALQSKWILERVGRERLMELVCNPPLTGFTAPKIIWVRENEPEVYRRAYKVLLPKDYIRFRLTGALATEVSDASGTVLFDVRRRRWSHEVMDALEIEHDLMPDCFESPVVSGEISGEASEETGLRRGTPVVGGGGDQAAGAVGNGVVREGVVSCTIGTSGVVFAASDEVRVDPLGRLHTFCHAVPGKWHVMGVMLSAGGSLRWFRDSLGEPEVSTARLCNTDAYELLTTEASTVEPGCEGLLFLPYLMGERTPYPDPDARGVFFGLTLRHRKPHMVRAVMEGVAYGMRDSLELVKGLGLRVEQVRASGGGARSRLWRQIQADIYGSEVVTVSVDEGPALGAALLAGVGSGVYGRVEEACDRAVTLATATKPNRQNTELYMEYYAVYRELYRVLEEEFDRVSGIVARRWAGKEA